jgi:cell division protein FtsZ
VLVNITGGPNMSMWEVEEATEIIHTAAGDDVNVILGAVVDESLTDEIMVTVIATGFNRKTTQVVKTLGGITTPLAPMKGVPPVRPTIDRIPSGAADLKQYDEPAYMRRGYNINPQNARTEIEEVAVAPVVQKVEEKPAFLRKIMD